MSLRPEHTLKSVDLRSLLACTPSSLSDLYKKLSVSFADAESAPRRGSPKHVFGTDVRRVLEAKGYKFPKTAKIIAFMMCKGGVGKTTSTFFLSQRLSAYGARVLAVDADPQGNLTSAFNLEELDHEIDEQTPILVDVISKECNITDATIEVTPQLHLIPSTPLNATMEARIRENYKNPSLAFSRAIKQVTKQYDYILIDCAPSLNLTNTAAISASNLVVLPVAPDKFSQIGLEQTLLEIEQIEKDFELKVEKKIIFTKFDGREFTSLKYLADIAKQYDDKRFSVAIRTCADVKNAVTRKEDLFNMSSSNAKEDYDNFTTELMSLRQFFFRHRTS